MAPRPPADAVVALRSLGRRARALCAGLADDESPEDLMHRNGRDGHSALDELVAATRTLTFLGRALDRTLIEDDAVLHPAVIDPSEREWPEATGSVDERVSELGWQADHLADRVEHLNAEQWARTARVAGHDATVSALAILWDAVDSAVSHLRAADRTLGEVRRQT